MSNAVLTVEKENQRKTMGYITKEWNSRSVWGVKKNLLGIWTERIHDL